MRKLFLFTFVTAIVVGGIWLIGKRDGPKGLRRAIGGERGAAEIQARAYPAELITPEQPQGTAVYARGINSISGAIICPDQRTVNMMFHLYNSSWEERFRSQLTNGQSELIDGKVAPPPVPEDYGCVLIAQGTPMREMPGSIVPVVSIHMPDGTNIKGVTMSIMIGSRAEKDRNDAFEAFRESAEDAWGDFQKQLPTLSKTKPNLRWYSTPTRLMLVIPYGPCAVLTYGNNGYLVREVNNQRGFAGPFAKRQEAVDQAETICESYARQMQMDPRIKMGPESSSIRKIWFKPDPEQRQEPTAEVTTATTKTEATPSAEWPSQTPAPIVRIAPSTAPTENFTWHTEPNGDEVLSGSSSGKCATIALMSAHDPLGRLHVKFSDGSTIFYSIEETPDAMQAAKEYCRKRSRSGEGAP